MLVQTQECGKASIEQCRENLLYINLTLKMWYFRGWPPANADEDLPLDAKMRMLKSNLTKFEKSLREGRVQHIGEFLRRNGLQVIIHVFDYIRMYQIAQRIYN